MYAFIHIFKTGGTTFNFSYVPYAFDRQRVQFMNVNDPTIDKRLAHISAMSEQDRPILLTGHGLEDKLDLLSEYQCFTFIRKPVDRIMSGYLHYKYHDDGKNTEFGRLIAQENISIIDLMQIDPWLQDYQTRILLGNEAGNVSTLSDEDILGIINKRFFFVGLTERLDHSMGMLSALHGFPSMLYNNRLVREERAKFKLSDLERNTISERCRQENRIYRLLTEQYEANTRTKKQVLRKWGIETFLGDLDKFRLHSNGDINKAMEWISPAIANDASHIFKIDLEQVQIHKSNDPRVEFKEGLISIETGDVQWGYACEFNLPTDLNGGENLVEVVYKLIKGSVGVAVCNREDNLVRKEVLFNPNHLQERCVFRVVNLDPNDRIIFRNTSEYGERSLIDIFSIKIIAVEHNTVCNLGTKVLKNAASKSEARSSFHI